jgi:hypothetical protein
MNGVFARQSAGRKERLHLYRIVDRGIIHRRTMVSTGPEDRIAIRGHSLYLILIKDMTIILSIIWLLLIILIARDVGMHDAMNNRKTRRWISNEVHHIGAR